MRFSCHVAQVGHHGWVARSSDPPVGPVVATAESRDAALEKLRAEIRYRLELCPCSGVGDHYIELDVHADRGGQPPGH